MAPSLNTAASTPWPEGSQRLTDARGPGCRYGAPNGLAQEVIPDSNDLLGNFPRAFSHIGLVNAAWAISTAEPKGDAS